MLWLKRLKSRKQKLSQYAPRLVSFKIDPERIGAVVGSGGKVINGIIAETNVTIDISDEGIVSICSTESEGMEKAKQMIDDILHEFKADEKFVGKVTRVMDFGVIVSLPGNNDGMVHVSEMAPYRVGSPSDLLKMGDEATVRVKEVAEGKISLSMKGLTENQDLWKDEKGKDTGGGFGGGNGGRPRQNDNRRSGGFNRR